MKIKTDRTKQNYNFTCFYRGAKLSLRKEHTPRVFENRVLTKMFGLKSDGVAGDWMRLCEELYNLNS